MGYREVADHFGKSVKKAHGKLPRTRCVAKMGADERIEFILPVGTDPATFCRGWKRLSVDQLVFPGAQPEIESVLINFDAVFFVNVIPEE